MDCSMPGFPVHHKLLEFIQTHVYWINDDIQPPQSSVIPFSSRLQSFPAAGSFQMSQFFTSGGQRIGVSASASVFPMNIQDWFPLGWTGWISLLSKGLSRVFSIPQFKSINSFFIVQLSHPYITTGHSLATRSSARDLTRSQGVSWGYDLISSWDLLFH